MVTAKLAIFVSLLGVCSMDDFMVEVGDRLNLAMTKRQIKAAVLAEELGISRSAVAHWCRGANNIRLSYLMPLCTALNISLSWLITGDGKMHELFTDEDSQGEHYHIELTREQSQIIINALTIILKKITNKSI